MPLCRRFKKCSERCETLHRQKVAFQTLGVALHVCSWRQRRRHHAPFKTSKVCGRGIYGARTEPQHGFKRPEKFSTLEALGVDENHEILVKSEVRPCVIIRITLGTRKGSLFQQEVPPLPRTSTSCDSCESCHGLGTDIIHYKPKCSIVRVLW